MEKKHCSFAILDRLYDPSDDSVLTSSIFSMFCVADMSSAMIKDDEHEMSCGRSALSSCIMIDCFCIAQFPIFLIQAAQQATWHTRTRLMCSHIFSVLGHDCHGTGHCICSSTCWIRATWLKQSAVIDSTSYDLP